MANEKTSVFVLWQSLVVDSYRSFFYELARRPGLTLGLACPRSFRELGGQEVPCAPFPSSVTDKLPHMRVHILAAFVWHVQIVIYRQLGGILRRFFRRGDPSTQKVFVCLAEPYALTTLWSYLLVRLFVGRDVHCIFYALQNIHKDFPRPLRWAQAYIFRQSRAALSLGEEQSQVLRRQGYRGPIIPFPLWYDTSRFRPDCALGQTMSMKLAVPALGKHCLKIGFIGSVSEMKGVFDLLEAFTLMSSQLPIILYIAGAGPDVEKMRSVMADSSKAEMMLYVGPLTVDETPQYMAFLDILIVPSLTMTHWKEQFGRVIIEALACGTTVLGSDSGEIPHVIGDPRRVFPERNPSALAKVLETWCEALSDKKRSDSIRADNAQRAAVTYSDITLAHNFFEKLQDL